VVKAKNCECRRRFRVGRGGGPKLRTQQLLGSVASLPTTAVVEGDLVDAVNIDDHEVVRDRGHGHRTGSVGVMPVTQLDP
jgi:hypothetical protein